MNSVKNIQYYNAQAHVLLMLCRLTGAQINKAYNYLHFIFLVPYDIDPIYHDHVWSDRQVIVLSNRLC